MFSKSFKKKNKRVRDLSRMLTTPLITEKLVIASAASLFNSVKVGAGGIVALIATVLVSAVNAESKLIKLFGLSSSSVLLLLTGIGLYGILGYIVCAWHEARLNAELKAIDDILAIRLARTGTSKSS